MPVQQDVSRLDVAMDLPCVMQVLETLESSVANGCYLDLVQLLLCYFDHILNTARIAVLENQPEVRVLNIGSIELDNVGTLALHEDADLFAYALNLRVDRKHLYGHRFPFASSLSLENLSVVTLAQQ